MTVIMKCYCKSDYQDKLYGQNSRIHNSCGKTQTQYRCTVCKSVK